MENQIMAKLAEHDEIFIKIDQRFNRVDEKFDQIDRKFEQIDKRFDVLENEVHRQGVIQEDIAHKVDMILEVVNHNYQRSVTREELAVELEMRDRRLDVIEAKIKS